MAAQDVPMMLNDLGLTIRAPLLYSSSTAAVVGQHLSLQQLKRVYATQSLANYVD